VRWAQAATRAELTNYALYPAVRDWYVHV